MSYLQQVLRAKQELSQRYLRPSAGSLFTSSVVTNRFLNVSDAVAAAHRNVHAVGVGLKIVQGQLTDTLCVRLYVVNKLATSLLSAFSMLPKAWNDIPTDVIEAPFAYIGTRAKNSLTARGIDGQQVVAASALAPCTTNRQTRQRPIIAGISAAHFQVTAGTIACFCRSTKSGDDPTGVYVLSNNHVFANVNKGIRGDNLLQPGPADGGMEPDDVFAKLERFVSLDLNSSPGNQVDCALGKIIANIDITAEVCGIGAITGTSQAKDQMPVRKHGRTTGYTEGVVTDISIDATVGMDHSETPIVAVFTDQMRIVLSSSFPAIGLGGDSGSLMVDQATSNAVGLYFAGPEDGSYGYANHIDHVLSALEISIM